MTNSMRELSIHELDLVAGGEPSDAWGSIGLGLGLIGAGLAIPLGTAGLATPGGIALVAMGVAAIHVGVAQLALEEKD